MWYLEGVCIRYVIHPKIMQFVILERIYLYFVIIVGGFGCD